MVDVVKYARGQIYWYNYVSTSRHTKSFVQSKSRPVLILSNSTFNHYCGLVAVVPLTSKLKKLHYFSHVKVEMPEQTSMVMVEQITTIDQSQLGDYIGTLSEEKMKLVEEAVQMHLGCTPIENRKESKSNDPTTQSSEITSTSSKHTDSEIVSNLRSEDISSPQVEVQNESKNTERNNSEPDKSSTKNNLEDSSTPKDDYEVVYSTEDVELKLPKYTRKKFREDYSQSPCSEKITRNFKKRDEYFSDNGAKIQFIRDYQQALEVPKDLRGEFLKKYGFEKFSTASGWAYRIRKELVAEGLL